MKLLVNAESLTPPLTGIGNYTLHLLSELSLLRGTTELEQIDCMLGQEFLEAQATLRKCEAEGERYDNAAARANILKLLIRKIPLAYRARQALNDLRLARQRHQYRHHIYHEPNFILKAHPGPCVATIHDLSFIHYPQHHPSERVAWMTGNLKKTLDRADRLITVSNVIRQELIDDLGVPAEKIQTTYLGVDPAFRPRPADQTDSVLKKYGLRHRSYLLFVGTLEPRKGIDLLLQAWTMLASPVRENYTLVLAGASGWHNADILAQMEALQARGEVRWLRYVPIDDLPQLYAGAAAFAYPSLYEGFGLPVLEAMASGVPVVCTADTSMAEFAEAAPLLFERGNADQLSENLSMLLEDSDLHQKHAQLGVERARKLNWRRFAEETLEVYRSIA